MWFGSTGHSQGGGAAITCAYLAEQEWGEDIKAAAHAIQPAHGMNRSTYTSEYPIINSPIFMFSGSADTVVPKAWVGRGYDLLNTETYWFEAVGATHINMNSWAKESAVPWFGCKLLNNQQACTAFLSLAETEKWKELNSKNTEQQ